MEDNVEKSFRWIFHGNIVVPAGNPFVDIDNNGGNKINIGENDGERKNTNAGVAEEILLGKQLSIKLDHILVVDYHGVIVQLVPANTFFQKYSKESIQNKTNYIVLDKIKEFLCPGFIDLHIHAPQYAFAGTATDRPLMGDDGWLETYTFPTEQSLGADPKFASDVYNRVVEKTLRMGTTTAVYFATLDLTPTKLLVDIVLEKGQRALVGKVSMDRNSPNSYCHSTSKNLEDTRLLIDYILSHPNQKTLSEGEKWDMADNLVLPLVTPRFIPTCSPSLLDGLGRIASEHKCHITSHISESKDEVEFSRFLDEQDHDFHPGRSDTAIFDDHKLLTDKCIMAHGNYLSKTDLNVLKARGSAVAHCPLSNFFFAGGCFPCRQVMEYGNKVGLGTDIAGGYSPSILNACQNAVIASHSLQHQQEKADSVDHDDDIDHRIDYKEAFYLATLGGATALGLEHKIGSLKVGMDFDAFVFSVQPSLPDVFQRDSIADIFQKLCTLGDDRNITRVFVKGRQVMAGMS